MDSWLCWFLSSSVTSLQGGYGLQTAHVANSLHKILVCHADVIGFHKQPISQSSSKNPHKSQFFPCLR